MKTSKRHHWVPQGYLRAFAADPGRREKIWRFGNDEKHGPPELKPIEKVAVRFHLYAPQDKSGHRDDSFERKLSQLENWLGEPVWTQLCTGMIDLQWKELRMMVSLLVAVMILRNPAQLDWYKDVHRNFVNFLSTFLEIPNSFEHKGQTFALDAGSWPEYRDADEEDLKREWIKHISSATWLAEILMEMRWAVICSDEPVFITTDNPVAIQHPSLEFRGLRNAKTSLMFPLSPTRLLWMDNRMSEPDGHYYRLKSGPGTFNSQLWRHANEYMFSHRDPDLVLAEMAREAEAMGFP